MKIRTGFVSNSSSSSFICEISGEEYTCMDATLEDAEMYECENGHIFLEEFSINTEEVINEDYDRILKEKNCPICQFKYIQEEKIIEYLMKRYSLKYEDIFNYMKSKNNRLRKVRPMYWLEYAYINLKKGKEDLVQEIKEKFNSFNEFENYLN